MNRGSAQISAHQTQQGIDLLTSLLNLKEHTNDLPFGDVFYNLGLAYESLEDEPEALRQLEMAAMEYSVERDGSLAEAMTHCKIAELLVGLGRHGEAAEAYGRGAGVFGGVGEEERRVVCLCRQADQCQASGRMEGAVLAADSAWEICQDSNKLKFTGLQSGFLYLDEYDSSCVVKPRIDYNIYCINFV